MTPGGTEPKDRAPKTGRVQCVGLLLPAGQPHEAASALAADLAHGQDANLVVMQPEPERSRPGGFDRLWSGSSRGWRPRWQLRSDGACDRDASGCRHPDLVVAPAGFDLRGRPAPFDDELGVRIARRERVPAVRVARRPLAIPAVLVVVRTAAGVDGNGGLPLLVRLWPDALAVVLPIGGEGARQGAEHRASVLAGAGMAVRIAPPLDDAFEMAEIDPYRSFGAVAMSVPGPRVGYIARACHDPAAALGATCALALLTP